MKPKNNIEIIDCEPKHYSYFKKFNLDWIEKYFEIEDSDKKILNESEKYILEKGGFIFMAKLKNEIVGTCALLKIDNYTFELAKMAVTEKAKGKGIGFLLGKKCIERAKLYEIKELFYNLILYLHLQLIFTGNWALKKLYFP